MATRQQVEAKLAQLIERLDAAGGNVQDSLAGALPERRVLALHVTDLDEHFWLEMSGGTLGPVNGGRHERPDIRVQVASDDLVDLVDGRASLFSRYLSGHVRIEASVQDLLRLRRLAG